MKPAPLVLVLLPKVPAVRGGAERLADELCRRLVERGCRSDVVTVPFQWEPKEIVIGEALTWRLPHLEADLVIPLKFPAYFIKHPRKVTWLCHQFRQLYELHGTPLGGFADTPPDHALRERLVAMDTRCLAESLAIYTISDNTLGRLRSYNGLDGEVLRVPPLIAAQPETESYGDYVLAVGRLEEAKRFDLLLRAAALTKSEVKVKIVGAGGREDELKALSGELGLAGRVEFLGPVSDDRLAELYAGCRAVHFAPLDEDYGLIAVEAMRAAKPVITAADSGGPTEVVRHGENGFVVPPDPARHAEALDTLWSDRDLCRKLGARGARDVAGITWEACLDRLLRWLPQCE